MIDIRHALAQIALSGLILAVFLGVASADDVRSKDSEKIDPSELQRFYDSILPDLAEGRRPEVADELLSILFGKPSRPVPASIGPAHSRYDWAWVSSHFDSDRNDQVLRKELPVPDATWNVLDRDGDSVVAKNDLDWEHATWSGEESEAQRRFRTLDTDNDGLLTADEWAAGCARAKLTIIGWSFAEVRRNWLLAQAKSRLQRGDQTTMTPKRRTDYVMAVLNQIHGTANEGPEVGDPAPDFSLKTHDGTAQISLSNFRGVRPVVLTFGSHTCPPYRQQVPRIDKLVDRYGDKVEILGVYGREAHPIHGEVHPANTAAGINVPQATTWEQRRGAAQTFCDSMKLRYPVLVDEIDDRVARVYSGFPDRFYIIDRNGKVAYKSGRGPRSFKTDQLEQSLVLLLLDEATAPPSGRR
jgi:Iodothyronine deiodinase